MQPFGRTPSGEEVELHTLTNAAGLEVSVMTYGATVVSVRVPDRSGVLGDVVLGFDTLSGYLGDQPYMGAVIGRYANRIAKGRFTLDGTSYALAVNNGPNSMHGGLRGFDKRVWEARPLDAGSGVELNYISADGEEGYPGTLVTRVTYELTDLNELRIEYEATADKATVANLTNHSYFNLADGGVSSIVDHEVTINAHYITPVGDTLIPTGDLRPVNGTAFDFRRQTAIGARIDACDGQLDIAGGYDHNYVLVAGGGEPAFAARVFEPTTGRVLEVFTSEPGVQFYTANSLDGTLAGKNGTVYHRRHALCLETQHFPDSPNHPAFPSTVVHPGDVRRSTSIYRFSVSA